MDRYLPITGIDCKIASLLIDTEAPLDVLHETAAHRIRDPTAGKPRARGRGLQRVGKGAGDVLTRRLRFARCHRMALTAANVYIERIAINDKGAIPDCVKTH